MNTFPLPFKSLRTICGGKDEGYVIGAMFTSAYSAKAERLAASCEKFSLPYVMHEVPSVHRSLGGLRGTDNLAYTKPNFIRHLLAVHKKPVLYVDADLEFMSEPELINQLVTTACDFGIYNKYADDECPPYFVPVELSLRPGEPPIKNRFYRLAGYILWHTKSQLSCYGCTLFYRNSFAARALLARWHQAIVRFPHATEEKCLDFVFNNLTRRSWLSRLLKVYWLPSSYARIPFWIFTKPVINHPEIPGEFAARSVPIVDPKGRKEVYRSGATRGFGPKMAYSENSVIDTEENMICMQVDGELVPVRPTDQNFWL